MRLFLVIHANGQTECRVRIPSYAIALLCVGLLFSLAACDRSRARIVGKWRVGNDANAMVWEFSPDGAVKAGETAGKNTFGDRSRLKIQTPSATFVYEIELTDDTMVWKEPSGARTELKRVP